MGVKNGSIKLHRVNGLTPVDVGDMCKGLTGEHGDEWPKVVADCNNILVCIFLISLYMYNEHSNTKFDNKSI